MRCTALALMLLSFSQELRANGITSPALVPGTTAGAVVAGDDTRILRRSDTLAGLRTLPGTHDGDRAAVAGFSSLDGGGGGTFRWFAGSTLADDEGTIVAAKGGVWRREMSATFAQSNGSTYTTIEFDPRWFGAKFDNSDSTASINAMIKAINVNYDSAGYGVVVRLPSGLLNTGVLTGSHRAIYWKAAGYRLTVWNFSAVTDATMMAPSEGTIFDGIQFGRAVGTFSQPLFTVAEGQRVEFRNTWNELNGPFVVSSGDVYIENSFMFLADGGGSVKPGTPVIDIQGGRLVTSNLKVSASNAANGRATGVRIQAAERVLLGGYAAQNIQRGVEVSPQSGQSVFDVDVRSPYIHDNTGEAIAVVPASGGSVRMIEIGNPDFVANGKGGASSAFAASTAAAASGYDGIYVGGAGAVGTFNLTGGVTRSSAGNGLFLGSGSSARVSGLTATANGGDGVQIGLGVSGFVLDSVVAGAAQSQAGNGGYGIHVAGTSHTNYVVSGSVATGNTGGDWLDESTRSDRYSSVGIVTGTGPINNLHVPATAPSTTENDSATVTPLVARGKRAGIDYQDTTSPSAAWVRSFAGNNAWQLWFDQSQRGTYGTPGLLVYSTANGVNALRVDSAAIGAGPSLSPYSSDSETALPLNLHGLGTGGTQLGSQGVSGSPVRFQGAQADASSFITSIVSGESTTIANNVSWFHNSQKAIIASYGITMPAVPIDRQELMISTNGVITSFKLSANSNQTFDDPPPPSLSAHAALRYRWVASLATWVHLRPQ